MKTYQITCPWKNFNDLHCGINFVNSVGTVVCEDAATDPYIRRFRTIHPDGKVEDITGKLPEGLEAEKPVDPPKVEAPPEKTLEPEKPVEPEKPTEPKKPVVPQKRPTFDEFVKAGYKPENYLKHFEADDLKALYLPPDPAEVKKYRKAVKKLGGGR